MDSVRTQVCVGFLVVQIGKCMGFAWQHSPVVYMITCVGRGTLPRVFWTSLVVVCVCVFIMHGLLPVLLVLREWMLYM